MLSRGLTLVYSFHHCQFLRYSHCLTFLWTTERATLQTQISCQDVGHRKTEGVHTGRTTFAITSLFEQPLSDVSLDDREPPYKNTNHVRLLGVDNQRTLRVCSFHRLMFLWTTCRQYHPSSTEIMLESGGMTTGGVQLPPLPVPQVQPLSDVSLNNRQSHPASKETKIWGMCRVCNIGVQRLVPLLDIPLRAPNLVCNWVVDRH